MEVFFPTEIHKLARERDESLRDAFQVRKQSSCQRHN